MANAHDAAIVEGVLRLPFPLNVETYFRCGAGIVDHSTYWQMLAAMWIGHGGTDRLDEWTAFFRADRPQRQKLMKGNDRRAWRRFRPVVVAHRAIAPEEDVSRAISWTLDRQFLAKIFPGRTVVTRSFQKKDILAYFDRRGESEIIVLPSLGRREVRASEELFG